MEQLENERVTIVTVRDYSRHKVRHARGGSGSEKV